ncbi:MAG: DUF523 domain-containing protein [Nitrospirae bacterium]|nr:MAG: DUF523 domain-containing protein [Nitrospirota bacterium]
MRHANVLRIGISRCLLGDPVRFDGGHKRDRLLIDALGQTVEWVPVCPEVEAGLGTPREPMQLVDNRRAPRLVTVETGVDHTEALRRFARQRVVELTALHLCGFVFKSASPSCGLRGVPLFDAQGTDRRDGIGLFAQVFMEHFPLIPVEEEHRLHDPHILKMFLERAADFDNSHHRA